MLITAGNSTAWIIASEVIWSPIQSIVVVTSPIGDQAPPELASITMIPAKNRRSSRFANNLRMSDIITMVVVKLSKIALRKKVTKPTSHFSDDNLVVLIRLVMTSTTVMAPIKKDTVCAVAVSDSPNCSVSKCVSPRDSA